jgi:hypothetical protein
VGAVVRGALLRVAARLDLLVRSRLDGRSGVVKLVACVLAARGLLGTGRGDA